MSLCYDFQKWTILTLGLVAISLSVGLVLQYAHGQTTTINDTAFSVDIPDNWTYKYNIFSKVDLTPSEFGALLIDYDKATEQMKDGGAASTIKQDWLFPIENAGFDLYVKYRIDEQIGMNVTSKQNVTIDNDQMPFVFQPKGE